MKKISSCYIKYAVKGTHIPMYALVDTGCEMSMLTMNDLNYLNVDKSQIMKTHQKLDTFGQTRFLITKCIKLAITLENTTKEHEIVFLIDEREDAHGITIGQDELRTMGCDIDFGTWNEEKCQIYSKNDVTGEQPLTSDLYYRIGGDQEHQVMFAKNFKSKKHFSSPYIMLNIDGHVIKTFL